MSTRLTAECKEQPGQNSDKSAHLIVEPTSGDVVVGEESLEEPTLGAVAQEQELKNDDENLHNEN